MKVIKTYILTFLFLTSLAITAQGGWKVKYYPDHSGQSTAYQAIEAPNGDFVFVGQIYDTLKEAYLLSVIWADKNGKQLGKKMYGAPLNYLTDMHAPKGGVVKDAFHFYHATMIWDPVLGYGSAIIKFDYTGDTIWQKKIYSNENGILLYFHAINFSIDGNFLITGIFENFNFQARQIALLKVDKNGKEIWRKKISKTTVPSSHCGQAIVQDTLTGKIIISGYQRIGDATFFETESLVLFCDSLGNRIDEFSFNNAGGGSFTDVIQLRDKNFLTCGAWKSHDVGSRTFYKSMLVKFNINGNVIWTKTYDPIWDRNGIKYLYEAPSGDIFMQGMLDSIPNKKGVIQPQIMRADKDGNLKWVRDVGNAFIDKDSTYVYAYEYCRSFNPTKDGGFILSSNFEIGPKPGSFMVTKIDSNACDTDEAYCKSLISDIRNFDKLPGTEFSIFPNPAADRVSVRVESDLEKLNLQISDISGRLLSQIKINESETNIDLSSFSEGTYFLRLYYNNQAVETRKLVIVR